MMDKRTKPDKKLERPQHDRRGHNGSTRGRKDMSGRHHKGSTGNGFATAKGY